MAPSENAMAKVEEQLRKSNRVDVDPINVLTGKFKRLLRQLKKKGKLDKKTYASVYSLDWKPSRLYGALKAHKPEKNYSLRAVVSTAGTPFL